VSRPAGVIVVLMLGISAVAFIVLRLTRNLRRMKTQRLAIQAAALQKHPAEAEVILRMLVIANAITAIGRTFDRSSSEMVSASDQRDLVCRWMLVASYLNEAVIILNKRHDGLAWKLAATGIAHGVTLPPAMPLDTVKSLMAADSASIKTCDHIRDKFAFHADKEPVMEWLNSRPPLESVGLMAQFGPHVQDIVFDAAAFAVFEAAETLLIDGFEKAIADVVFALPHFVEAMIRGLIVNHALTVEMGEKTARISSSRMKQERNSSALDTSRCEQSPRPGGLVATNSGRR